MTVNGQKTPAAKAGNHGLPQPPAPCWAVGTAGPGSSGATTLAVALAAHVGGILIEADSDGGVLAARYGCWLNEGAPSLASLLAALHMDGGAHSLHEQVQRLPNGSPAVLIAPGAEEATGPIARLVGDLPQVRSGFPDQTMILDVGRLRADGPGVTLASQADAVIVVAQPHVETLGCLLARLPRLLERNPRVVIAIRGDGAYPLVTIRDTVYLRYGWKVPVLHIPEDRLGVAALAQPPRAERRGRSGQRISSLSRSLDALVHVLPGTADSAIAPHGVTR